MKISRNPKWKLSRRRPRVEIIPMIDVVFFLLAFFLLSVQSQQSPSHQAPEQGLKIELPHASAPTLQDSSAFILQLRKDGVIFLNQVRTTSAELTSSLQSLKNQNKEQDTLLVQADQGVSYQAVMTALSAAHQAGFSRFSLASQH